MSEIYTSRASSFTADEEQRFIDALSSDGTLQGIDPAALEEMLRNGDESLGDLEDIAYLYTLLTGSWPSSWDAELASPDDVEMLEEWADLAVSEDLATDINAFIALLGPEEELMQTGVATLEGGPDDLRGMSATYEEIVSTTNSYYETSSAAAGDGYDFSNLIHLAFAMGNPALALIWGLAGHQGGKYDDGTEIDAHEGLNDIIADGQINIADKLEENTLAIQDINDRLVTYNYEDPSTSGLVSADKSELDMIQTINSTLMQSMTTLSDIGNQWTEMSMSLMQQKQAVDRKIWS